MKSIIIKTTFILLALFLVLDAAEAQMNLNEIADAEPFHKVAQIKGTENLLRDYFSGISNENDTLYVVLCPLMFCPRCEAEIGVVQELLYMRKPDNPMVMIASSPNKQAAQKYVAKKFDFEDVIYDTDLSFKSFLAFRTEEPRIPFIMKIDIDIQSRCPITASYGKEPSHSSLPLQIVKAMIGNKPKSSAEWQCLPTATP